MKSKSMVIVIIIALILGVAGIIYVKKDEIFIKVNTYRGVVISKIDNKYKIKINDTIYELNEDDFKNLHMEDEIEFYYENELEEEFDIMKMRDYKVLTTNDDDDIFGEYIRVSKDELFLMNQDEKIAQLLLVRYPDYNGANIQSKYQFGGYIFFARDFNYKTKNDVIEMISSSQKVSKIPMLIAVDEEGGNVVRVSSNKSLVSERFKSPQELYRLGGFSKIKEDTINKSNVLKELGINLNLAPVVDISENRYDYMYNRTIGLDYLGTGEYAKTVIEASKGLGVSYTLKHFPGYGNNLDTHKGISVDNRSFEEIDVSMYPFKEGIDHGAEAVMVSHNIINSVDKNLPASLSPSIHKLLRENFNFKGIIITDDLVMQALDNIGNKNVKAILADNDLLITTNYEESMKEIKKALDNGELTEDMIDTHVLRILAWKHYKGLI